MSIFMSIPMIDNIIIIDDVNWVTLKYSRFSPRGQQHHVVAKLTLSDTVFSQSTGSCLSIDNASCLSFVAFFCPLDRFNYNC